MSLSEVSNFTGERQSVEKLNFVVGSICIYKNKRIDIDTSLYLVT